MPHLCSTTLYLHAVQIQSNVCVCLDEPRVVRMKGERAEERNYQHFVLYSGVIITLGQWKGVYISLWLLTFRRKHLKTVQWSGLDE